MLCLGPHSAMWGERTDDGSIDTEVWPDTCAAAERLWSSAAFDFNPAAALLRLIPHRCRMYQRGIRAKSLDGTLTSIFLSLPKSISCVLDTGSNLRVLY